MLLLSSGSTKPITFIMYPSTPNQEFLMAYSFRRSDIHRCTYAQSLAIICSSDLLCQTKAILVKHSASEDPSLTKVRQFMEYAFVSELLCTLFAPPIIRHSKAQDTSWDRVWRPPISATSNRDIVHQAIFSLQLRKISYLGLLIRNSFKQHWDLQNVPCCSI